MPEEDRKKLIEFVSNIGQDVGFVALHAVEINPELEQFLPQINKSWKIVEPRFERINEYLMEKRPLPDWAPMKMEDELEDRGLVGVQLELKLSVYQLLRRKFYNALEFFIGAARAKRKEWEEKRNVLMGFFSRFFGFANVILESLGFIPGTHAVKEFKGVLEGAIP